MRGKLLAVAAAGVASALIGATAADAAVAVYGTATATCRELVGVISSHRTGLIVAGLTVVGVIAATGFAAALLQWRRTTRALRAFRLVPATSMPARVAQIARRLHLTGRIDVADAESLFAVCHGILTPRVIVSTRLVAHLSDDELEAVLRHEAAHLRRRDPLRILVARSIARACAFLPVTSMLLEAYLCKREVQADRDSVRGMGDVLPLAAALQRMLSSAPASRLPSLAVAALTGTDVRIDRLLGDTSSRPTAAVNRFHLVAFAAAAAIVACVLVSAAYAWELIRCLPC